MAQATQPSKTLRSGRGPAVAEGPTALGIARKAIFWWLPLLYFLVSDSFYLRTYDSAQVKITLVQMGGAVLLTLWLCLLVEEGFKAFRREDLVTLAPFLAFFASGIVSFLHAPYPGPSIDDFIRRCVYMTAALIIVREFNDAALQRLTKWIVWTCAVAVLYGFLQWIDTRFFPRGIDAGVDPFIWRWAFEQRVFSTFGNPNFFADFLVLTYPILVAQFLKNTQNVLDFKTWSWRYVPLIFLLGLDLYSTETKGAWIGFTVSVSIFVVVYSIFFVQGDLRSVLKRAFAIIAVIGLVLGSIVLYYTRKRISSVNFRVATWLSTWEMIESHPFIGTGIGSFKVIYPAFRRPAIFHIEAKSNTETDHSENEWLEEWFDEGVLGFGIFIWLVFSTAFIGFKAIHQLTGVLALKGGRPPPRAFDILGYLIALLGMLAHNFFDVSMRFVSSGVYLGLLSGLVVNLAHGFPLSHVQDRPDEEAGEPAAAVEALLWLLRAAAWGALAWAAFRFLSQFSELQGPLANMHMSGEVLQWWIAWALFGGVVLGLTAALIGVTLYARRWLTPLIVLACVPALNLFWGYFKADVYHNMAIAYSKGGQWNEALHYYLEVVKLNPNYVMTNYFKGNVFVDRLDMRREFHPEWGDPIEGPHANEPRDDFQRAEGAYAQVLERAPNYVQTHHQRGVLYFKRGQYALDHGDPDAQKYWDEAILQFRKYQRLDPVWAPNYFRLAQIYVLRKDYDKAISVYNEYLEAKPCVVHRHDGLPVPGFSTGEGPTTEANEAYTLIGNAQFLKGDLNAAAQAYQMALKLNPDNAGAKQNLAFLYQKLQELQKKQPAPTPLKPKP